MSVGLIYFIIHVRANALEIVVTDVTRLYAFMKIHLGIKIKNKY